MWRSALATLTVATLAACGGREFEAHPVESEDAGDGIWIDEGGAVAAPDDAGIVDASSLDATGGDGPIDAPTLVATSVGASPTCVPYASVQGEPFVAAAAPTTQETAAALLVGAGTWFGLATAPQNWAPPSWSLVLEFTADTGVGGHYSAYAFGEELPFYYGAPGGDCLPLDQWSMLTGASARIDVPFDYGTDGCGLPTWQGKLDAVRFDADGNRAQFQFSTSDGYGPVLYDMWRVCPAPAGDL